MCYLLKMNHIEIINTFKEMIVILSFLNLQWLIGFYYEITFCWRFLFFDIIAMHYWNVRPSNFISVFKPWCEKFESKSLYWFFYSIYTAQEISKWLWTFRIRVKVGLNDLIWFHLNHWLSSSLIVVKTWMSTESMVILPKPKFSFGWFSFSYI